MLRATLDAQVQLETLVLGNVNYHFLDQGQTQMSQLAQVLRPVQYMHWDVGEAFVGPSRPEEMYDGNDGLGPIPFLPGPNIDDAEFNYMHDIFEEGLFSSFIATATNLQTLVVNMPELGSTQLVPVNLADVVGRLHFPNLRSFSLKRVETTPQALESFLLRHKDLLTELRICDLYMDEDTDADGSKNWDDFFRSIGGKMPCLKKVSLRGGLHSERMSVSHVFGHNLSEYVGTPFSRAMEAFMIHGGPRLPSGRGYQHSDLPRSANLQEWAGEALMPEIRPIGWDISWEL